MFGQGFWIPAFAGMTTVRWSNFADRSLPPVGLDEGGHVEGGLGGLVEVIPADRASVAGGAAVA